MSPADMPEPEPEPQPEHLPDFGLNFAEAGQAAEQGLVAFSSFILQYIVLMGRYDAKGDMIDQMRASSKALKQWLDALDEHTFGQLVSFFRVLPHLYDTAEPALVRAALRRGWEVEALDPSDTGINDANPLDPMEDEP